MHLYTDFLMVGANVNVGGLRIGDALVTLFFFLVLLVILRKVAWGPLMNIMEEREKHVANELDVAEKSRKEAEIQAKEATAELKQTRQDAERIIEEAKTAGQKQEQDIIESARQEAARIKVSAQEDIQSEKEKAILALQDQVASLSVLIASKVIEKEISAQDQDDLIAEYIKEVGEEQ